MIDKKLILRAAIKLMSIIAISLTAYVFILSLTDNKNAQEGMPAIQIDASKIKPGEVHYFKLNNKKLMVLHRSSEMLEQLDSGDDGLLKDFSDSGLDDGLNKKYRSFSKSYFVAYAYDPFYGCDIKLSGYAFVPVCIDLKYDLSGRVFKSRRAEQNLIVPKHDIKNKTLINIQNN